MGAIIRIKRSTGTTAPASLGSGELAFTSGTGTQANEGERLFFGKGDDGAGVATSIIQIGGSYYTNLLDHVHGTTTASSALIVGASKDLDVLTIGNILVDSSEIRGTVADGNIVIRPNGTGTIDVTSSRIVNLATPSGSNDAATKAYVDTAVGGLSTIMTFGGDTGSDTLNLADSALTVSGGTGLSTEVTNNTININLDNTGVDSASYGSSTTIPVITVNAQGQITTASTATISTSLSTAGDTGTGDVSLIDSSLSIVGGEGIDTVVSNNQVTISGEDATTSNKGIASFNSASFDVTSGAVSIATGGVSNAQLEGSIANDKLVNSTITLGSSTLTLGATTTDISGLTSLAVDNISINGNTISSTDGSNTLYIDPAPTDSDGGDLIIRGNLTVQGTQTIINSSTLSVNDLNIVLADSATDGTEADGAGITVGGTSYAGTKPSITWDNATTSWDFNYAVNVEDSIGGANTIFFNDVKITEAVEDHLVNNFFLAGEGIDLTYVDSDNTLTVAAELATISNPGVASFDSDQFTVTSGAVSITVLDGGTF